MMVTGHLPMVMMQMMETTTEMEMICQAVYLGGAAKVALVPLEKLTPPSKKTLSKPLEGEEKL